MSFRQRLALFLTLALVAVQLLTAVVGYFYLRHSLVEKGKSELAAESANFNRQLNILSERATDGVEVLSLDYPLRQAIGQNDRDTELSALRNHGRRIGAARMLLVGLDGIIIADTQERGKARGAFVYPALLRDAAMNNHGTALATFDGRLYWIVVAPIRAPVPIAFIAACIPVDNALLTKLREISALKQSIALATRDGQGRWTIAASSADQRHDFAIGRISQIGSATAHLTQLDDREFLTISAPLHTARNSLPVIAIFSYPLAEALSPYRAILLPVLLVLIGALAVTLLGAMWIVRSFAAPLESLARSAQRIAQGDYTPPPHVGQHDELGYLSGALINMTQSIAHREAALTSAVGDLEVARNEAVKANDAKSQFLANMSHELRTPLNAIVGFSEMLHQQMLGPLGAARYVEYSRDISQSGGHLLQLVAKMLDLADFEAGRLQLSRCPTQLSEIIRQSIAATSDFAGKSSVDLDFARAHAPLPEIDGDSLKLTQALSAVLHNAVKFTPPGGTVRIDARVEAGEVCISVEDSGTGMSAEDAAIVVRPFHRMRSALEGRHQGAGLGLPFAHAVVTLHGGAFSIESAPGQGTKVRIRLPYAAAARRHAA